MLQETSRPGVLDTLREITAAQTAREKLLTWRYPWFNVVYNYLWLFIAVLLLASLIWWSGNGYKERKDAEEEESNRVTQEEIAKAEAEEAEKERNDRLDRWAEAGAKMLWGIRLFIDNYNYSQTDLETYLRCPWNRYLSDNKLTDLEKIIFREEQFTGAYRTNAAPDRYKAFARKMFEKFEAEEEPACDIKYVCAELKPDGIYLVPKPDSDGYVQRYHAS